MSGDRDIITLMKALPERAPSPDFNAKVLRRLGLAARRSAFPGWIMLAEEISVSASACWLALAVYWVAKLAASRPGLMAELAAPGVLSARLKLLAVDTLAFAGHAAGLAGTALKLCLCGFDAAGCAARLIVAALVAAAAIAALSKQHHKGASV
ncbi:MAG: hypothetical protein WC421_06760 [Elusimicrobiales bacterium]